MQNFSNNSARREVLPSCKFHLEQTINLMRSRRQFSLQMLPSEINLCKRPLVFENWNSKQYFVTNKLNCFADDKAQSGLIRTKYSLLWRFYPLETSINLCRNISKTLHNFHSWLSKKNLWELKRIHCCYISRSSPTSTAREWACRAE